MNQQIETLGSHTAWLHDSRAYKDKFITQSNETNVTIYEASKADTTLQKKSFKDSEPLQRHCSETAEFRLRIISIPQEDSYEGLQITRSCMQWLLDHHRISDDHGLVLQAVGSPPRECESGYGMPIRNQFSDGSFSLMYLQRYYEKRQTVWKLRQTGVYHGFSASTNAHVFLLTHPRKDSSFQMMLESVVENVAASRPLLTQPLKLHAMLLSCYLANFHLFLRTVGEDFTSRVDRLLRLDYLNDETLNINFEELQHFREIDDELIPLPSFFHTSIDILEILVALEALETSGRGEVDGGSQTTSSPIQVDYFQSRKNIFFGLKASSLDLQKRVRGALSLLTETLELRNQQQLSTVNENLYKLQQKSVDDNVTVKIVTIVSLIYLPFSFVATLFGMNFFTFNNASSKLRIASNFWVYVVFSVPLTLLTVAWWYFETQHRKHDGERDVTSESATSCNSFQMSHLRRFRKNLKSMGNGNV